jgi:hypothetical protein
VRAQEWHLWVVAPAHNQQAPCAVSFGACQWPLAGCGRHGSTAAAHISRQHLAYTTGFDTLFRARNHPGTPPFWLRSVPQAAMNDDDSSDVPCYVPARIVAFSGRSVAIPHRSVARSGYPGTRTSCKRSASHETAGGTAALPRGTLARNARCMCILRCILRCMCSPSRGACSAALCRPSMHMLIGGRCRSLGAKEALCRTLDLAVAVALSRCMGAAPRTVPASEPGQFSAAIQHITD